jgi:phospholipid/cholesterol/gamma-HCH transport system substrate-binding protein
MSAWGKTRDFSLGLLAIVLAMVLLVVAYLAYDRALVPSKDIILRTSVVGNQLQVGSDVKLNGVPVGSVSNIDATTEGASLTLALNPDTLHLIPENTVARLLPKTLFGERYIALVAPGKASSQTLQAGDVIYQDPSAEAAELQQVLDDLLPVLQKIQPDKLSAMLGELAEMLHGNGEDLGDTMVAWQRYVKKLNPLVPQMTDDLEHLGHVAQDWNVAAPDLLDALSTMTTSTKTLVDEKTQLRDVYASVIGTADTTRGWVSDNSDTIIILSKDSRAALRATAPYASQFPCLFRAVSGYIPKMEKALGKGTDEPGIHAVLQMMPIRSKYLAGDDDVHYTPGTPDPRCPYVTGQVGTSPADRVTVPGSASNTDPAADTRTEGGAADPTAQQAPTWPAGSDAGNTAGSTGGTDDPAAIAPPPSNTLQAHMLALVGLGDANSPGENELIAELVAPTQGMAPGDYPDWNSLLLGPTLRNTKVVLR